MLTLKSSLAVSLIAISMVACTSETASVDVRGTAVAPADSPMVENTSAPSPPSPTSTEVPATPTMQRITPSPSVVATLPTATATHTPTPSQEVLAVVDNCVGCHSDKDQLINTLSPPEEVAPSESSGVG